MEDFIKLFKSIKVVSPQSGTMVNPTENGFVHYLFKTFDENNNLIIETPRQVGGSTILDAYIIYKSLNNVSVYSNDRFGVLQKKIGYLHGYENCFMKGGRIRQPYGAEITTNIIGSNVDLSVIDNPRNWINEELIVSSRKTIILVSGTGLPGQLYNVSYIKNNYTHIKLSDTDVDEINKKFIRINKINRVLE